METNEKINDLILKVDRLEAQVQRLQSHVDSESGTLNRETTRLMTEISKMERTFNDLFYNMESGLLVRIDRLLQESNKRQKTGQNIIALWIILIPVVIKIVWDFFNKK